MKICFVASSYPRYETDGSARFIRSMAEALVDLGHVVDVIVPHRADLNLAPGKVRVFPFRYIWPPKLAIMGYAEAMHSDRQLRRLAYGLAPSFALAEACRLVLRHRRMQYDVIHAHWVVPNGVVAAAVAAGIHRPLVISLHGSDVFFARKHRLFGAAAGWAFARAAAVTACSPELYDGARVLGADPAMLHLLPWGADPAVFDAAQPERDRVRGELGVHPGHVAILSLGRLVSKKGVGYLLTALPAIVRDAPNAVCWIAGSGPERTRLEQLAGELGVAHHVRFLGNVSWDRAPALFAAADIFVAPSVHDEQGNVDGLPTTILEAMAAGKPVVASRVGGIELAVLDSINGLLTTERDAAALATAILALIKNDALRARLGENGRETVRRELNWAAIARKLVELYTIAVADAPRRQPDPSE
jgi:glycosyltransferase involved in cell wall biosynthesis